MFHQVGVQVNDHHKKDLLKSVKNHLALLVNIPWEKCCLNIYCTAGRSITNMINNLPGFGTVWLNEKDITNALSLAKVVSQIQITYDSTIGERFQIHKPDGMMKSQPVV
eukprot:7236795-Ditylum_brightwellii.AAC.2